VEHLLSALEMLGVDNARIEVEGGSEVPIVDGSALGWTVDVQSVSRVQGMSSLQPAQPAVVVFAVLLSSRDTKLLLLCKLPDATRPSGWWAAADAGLGPG
jgi:UDP-3-O-acyl-N-acetylglucosamine deacetylase